MKNIILLLITLVNFSLSSYGQISPQEERANMPVKLYPQIPVDTSNLDCIYQYDVFDKDLDVSKHFNAILQIGDSICKYEEYSRYRQDSAYLAMAAISVVTNRDYDILTRKYSKETFFERLMINLNSNRLDFLGKVFMDNYTYNEPIPTIDWQLKDSVKEVCGYQCQQATSTFRGLKWTAWYCDIPKSVGPWKLGGLPGLILEAYTEDKDHYFVATTIRKSKNVITYEKRDYFKTTRERFNNSYAKYRSNPGQAWNNSPLAPKDMNGNVVKVPRRKLFFNPLEKE